MNNSSPFKWRHFEPAIIVCGVRWYLRYALSYRDVEELMRERGTLGGSYDRVSLGAALCAGIRHTLSPVPPSNHRLLPGRRDIYQDQKAVALSVSGRGYHGRHAGLHAESHPRCRGGGTLFPQGPWGTPYDGSACDHRGQARCVSRDSGSCCEESSGASRAT
jgi:hypothetical protein